MMDLYDRIQKGHYIMPDVEPRREQDTEAIKKLMETEVGTWVEINEKIEAVKQLDYDNWVEKREKYWKEQKVRHDLFKKDVIEHWGVTGNPKADKLFELVQEHMCTVEEIVEEFGRLVILIK